MTMDDWRWIIDVNLYGVIHGVNVFLPLLQANRDGGHIVNTASNGSSRWEPLPPEPAVEPRSVLPSTAITVLCRTGHAGTAAGVPVRSRRRAQY